MPDTVTVPAVGPVKRQWLYISGAAIVGYVGFAYWRARKQATPTTPSVDDFGVGTYTPPEQVPVTQAATGEFGSGGVFDTPTNNAQWSILAVQRLSDIGFDLLFASVTIGKYLARRELTIPEVELIQAALSQVGTPPQGGPYPVLPAHPVVGTPPPASALTPPAFFTVAPNVRPPGYLLRWSSVDQATGYQIRAVTGHTGDVVRTLPKTTNQYLARIAPTKGHLAFEVRTLRGSQTSPWKRTTIRA